MPHFYGEINQRLDFALVEAIRAAVKETHIHPLNPEFMDMLKMKITACAVQVWVEMGKPSENELENVLND